MSGWTPKNLINEAVLIRINQTAAPLTAPTSIYSSGALEGMVIGIFVTGVAGTSTIQLQHSLGLDVWENVTGKVTATLVNGWNYIKIFHNIAADAALLPLYDVARLVLTSNGTGAGQITSIKILQQS